MVNHPYNSLPNGLGAAILELKNVNDGKDMKNINGVKNVYDAVDNNFLQTNSKKPLQLKVNNNF
jgi:hypothetical protein